MLRWSNFDPFFFSAFTVNRLSELEATNYDMNEINDVKDIDRDLSGQITIIPKPEFFRILGGIL